MRKKLRGLGLVDERPSRHENELRAALDYILQGTSRKGGYFVADMSKREDVRRLAQDALTRMRARGQVFSPEKQRWSIADPLLGTWARDHAPVWVRRRAQRG